MSEVQAVRAGPTREELVARATELQPLLASNAAVGDVERRLSQTSVDALAEAGLFSVLTPARFGGSEADMRTMLEVSAALAEGDGSASWANMLINVCNWMTGCFGDAAQSEVFGSKPGARVAGVLAPTSTSEWADGGLRVTGRWDWSSGILHADWGIVGLPIVDPDGTKVDDGVGLIPISELSVEDTWFTSGMRGTGSNTIVAQEVFVPEHRLLSASQAIAGVYPTEHTAEALYRSAWMPVLALVLIGPQLGLARAAFKYVVASAPSKPVSLTFFTRQADSTTFQNAVAEASLKIDTAHFHAFRAAADIDTAAAAGVYPDVLTRARVRADTGYVIRQVTESIQVLLSAHGASSFRESNVMQRIWRDSNVAGRHAIASPLHTDEIYGKALLGIEENITPFI